MMDAAWAARLQAVFELSPTILTVTGLDDGRIVEVNDAFLLATGYSRNEVIGRSVPEIAVWVAPDQRDALLHQLMASGQARDFEVTFRTKTGEERQLLTNSEMIAYEGEPAVLSVSVDITERKLLEAQREARREEAETLTRTKDEFLAILSHELRNPLGAITNALGVMDRLVTSNDLRNVLGIIGRQTARLTRLVDD